MQTISEIAILKLPCGSKILLLRTFWSRKLKYKKSIKLQFKYQNITKNDFETIFQVVHFLWGKRVVKKNVQKRIVSKKRKRKGNNILNEQKL